MTIKEAFIFGETKLSYLETPHLDAAVLLAFITKQPKIFLYAHGEKNLTATQWSMFKKLIRRRMRHEPIAYLVGEKEFYGRTFSVDQRVLIPRPETELIVDIAKHSAADTIIDVGTGSGALAVTLVKELRKPTIALDISNGALSVAKHNAKHHHVNVKFLRGNLLEPILPKFKIKNSKLKYLIVANLPYLPTARKKLLSIDIKKYEPMLALMGGNDGLTYYRQLTKQLKNLSAVEWTLVAEIDALQEKKFTHMVKKILPTAGVLFHKDLSGTIRVAVITKS